MNSNNKIFTLSTVFVSLIFIGGCGTWILINYYQKINNQIIEIQSQLTQKEIAESQKSEPVTQIITSAQLWRPIQERVQDTVVQIFAQVAAIDILQPYKTPIQGAAYGTGFFVNKDGDLITNAHVVNQAKALWIQIPSLGKTIIDVEVVGISPDRDVALLRLTQEAKEIVEKNLGSIPFLKLGNSDTVLRSDEVLALGYPLGQQSLKSTSGMVSGRERNLIQISAAINPGSSGGPLLNTAGEVIGINSSGIVEAQNVGYAIPINDLTMVLQELYSTPILRRPALGVIFNNGSRELTEYLGNPLPGGCYVVGVLPGSTMEQAGIKRNDMIYEINGNKVDLFGEMKVDWSEDKISIIDFVGRLPIDKDVKLVAYRNGKRIDLTIPFTMQPLPAIRKIYPGYESIDYEIFGGMVVTPLTINHIHMMVNDATGLADYAEIKNQSTPVLVITHIFPNSAVYRSRSLTVGSTIEQVNGMPVHTLEEFRNALKKGVNQQYATISCRDHVRRIGDSLIVVLDYHKVVEQEMRLSLDYKYPLSDTIKELRSIITMQKELAKSNIKS